MRSSPTATPLTSSWYFILLASPEAARSRWVDREVRWWLEHRSPATMLIGLTSGELAWDGARGAFDPARTTALPPGLLVWPGGEPLWVDLRWARQARHVSQRDPRFREAVADLAAPVHDLPKDELIGEDIRQHRRALRQARGAAAARNELEGRLDRALLLAAEGMRLGQSEESRDALITALQYDPRRLTYVWPKARVDAVAFSPDGRLLGSSGYDDDHLTGPFPVTVTDLRRHRSVASLSRPARIRAMAFSPDGRLLALAEDSVTLWDTSSWRQRGAPLPVRAPSSLSFSQDGRVLAVGATDAASLWDIPSRRELGSVAYPEAIQARVAISPDARLLAVGAGQTTSLWSLQNGRPGSLALATFPLQGLVLAFNPDGSLLATGASDGVVTIVGTATGSALVAFRAHDRGRTWGQDSPVTGLAFRRDGRTLLSAGDDGAVKAWDARSGKPRGRPLRGHEGGIAALALGPDDRTLASGGVDERIAVWDLERAGGLGELAAPAPALDGLLLTKEDVGLHVPRPTHEYAGFAWPAASSDSVASTVQAFTWRGGRLSLTRWDGTGRLLPALPSIDIPSRGDWQHLAAALSPDQGTLVVGDDDGVVRFFDARTGRELGPALAAHGGPVEGFAFSSDGNTMVSASVGEGSTAEPDPRRSLVVWGARSHLPRGAPLTGHQTFVTALALDRTGRRAVTGSGPEVFVWDLGQRRLLRRMKGHAPGPRAIGPTGSSPDEDVWAVALSPDGRMMASAAQDETIRFYDLEAGRPVGDGVPVPSGFIDQLSFSDDGKTLVATDGKQTVLVDTASQALLGEPIPGRGVTGPGSGVAFLADGAALRLWRHDPDSLLSQACARANRNLSRQEWERFVGPTHPYHLTCAGLPEG
jgi:WD40 repeat protein